MANLPEKIITTVDKITEIPSNTMIFVNADGVFNQANIDDIVRASSVVTDSIANQFKKAIGAEILATDSSKGNIIDFSSDGRSTQDETPTPDVPIDIKSVGDKGWFDGELLQGLYAMTNGIYASNNYLVCNANKIPCKESDNIKIIYGTTTRLINVLFYDINGTYLSGQTQLENDVLSVVAPANSEYFNFNVSESTTETLTPQTAKKIIVTINDTYVLKVKTVGKNWLPNNAISQTIKGITWTRKANGSFIANGTATEDSVLYIAPSTDKLKIPTSSQKLIYGGVKGGSTSTYYIQIWRGAWIPYVYVTDGDYLPSISSEDYELTIALVVKAGVTVNNVLFEPIIRPADTDNTYVPHEEKTTYIPLTEPLRGIGEVKDKVVKVDGVWGVLRRITERIFDDTANWLVNDSFDNTYYVGANIGLKVSSLVGLSSHYIYNNSTQVNNVDYCMFIGSYINFKNANISSLDDWKVWVTENPIIVQYERETEVFEPFADQTPFYEMQMFNEATYITVTDYANMMVEYPTTRTAGVASIGFAKGNLADIKIEQLNAQMVDVQTALLNV